MIARARKTFKSSGKKMYCCWSESLRKKRPFTICTYMGLQFAMVKLYDIPETSNKMRILRILAKR